MGIAADLIYILLAAVLGGFIAHSLRQPVIFGYIFAGLLVGPYTIGPTVERIHDIEMLAEIGVALLLFTLGLEFSFRELKRMARLTLVATPIQILLTSAAGYFAARLIGSSPKDSLWIGAAVSLSSTMVVIKTLGARDELESRSGRIMLTVLIAQDLAVVPLMLLLPQLTGTTIDVSEILSAIAKSALFLVLMFFAGTRFFPKLLEMIARRGSPELFFLCTLATALGAGFLSYQLGLSFALGAFVAGMLLSETDFNHQALSEVSNLRDLFGLLFFVSVGMLFDPTFFIANLGKIFFFTFSFVVLKALILAGIIRFLGFDGRTSVTVGLGLSQIGEFAFVIANAGSRAGLLSAESYSLMIAVTVCSMFSTAGLFALANRISERSFKAPLPETDQLLVNDRKDHVIIIGGGVVGRYIARVLSVLKMPYVVIENEHRTFLDMQDETIPAIFGDGTRRTILESAGILSAKLIVVTTTNDRILPLLLSVIRDLTPNLPVVVRVEEVADIEELARFPFQEIVQPQMEVGLEMVRQAFLALGMQEREIFAVLGQLRAERYGAEALSLAQMDGKRLHASKLLELLWFEAKDGCELVENSIGELRLRERFEVSVVAILRGEEFTPNPGPTYTISIGDTLGILGTETQLRSFRAAIQL